MLTLVRGAAIPLDCWSIKMGLRDCLSKVLSQYKNASIMEIKGNPLAHFVRTSFRDTVAGVIRSSEIRYVIKGSVGQGQWARGPWVGIFSPLVTAGAQTGYYPVYLFREDLGGVYLSLNQGMTDAVAKYRSDAKTALRAKSYDFRAMLGGEWRAFPLIEIDLAPSAASNPTAFYEVGNVCAKYYPAGSLPSENELVNDLREMVALYGRLYELETLSGVASEESQSDVPVFYEDAGRFRLHTRIERNSKLTKLVKKLRGHICEVCSLDFEDSYGDIGKGYIEAHHLRPLSSLKGLRVAMDPLTDFAVLCANCHRMVHRSGLISDIPGFREKYYQKVYSPASTEE